VTLRPLVIARCGHALFGGAVAAGSTNLWDEGSGRFAAFLGAIGFTLGIVVVVRSFLMRVVVADGVVDIQGWMWSRRIPRAVVTGVSEFPAVRWTDASGRKRWSPVVWMMRGGRALPFIERYNQEQVEKLRKLVKPKR